MTNHYDAPFIFCLREGAGVQPDGSHDIKMQIVTLLEKENGRCKTATLCAAFQKSSQDLRPHFMALHESGLARWEAGERTLILTAQGKKLLADSAPGPDQLQRP